MIKEWLDAPATPSFNRNVKIGFVIVVVLMIALKLQSKSPSYYDFFGWKLKQWIPKGSIVLGNDNLWAAFNEDYKFWGENAVIDGAGNRYFGKRVGEKVYTDWIGNYRNRILKDLNIQYIIIDDELYHYLTDSAEGNVWNKEFWKLLEDSYIELAEVQDKFYTSEQSRSRRPMMTTTKIYIRKGLQWKNPLLIK